MVNDDNYLWEESFVDEKGRLMQQAAAASGQSGSFNSSAILQDMLKDVNEATLGPVESLTAPEAQTAPEEAQYIRAPLTHVMAEDAENREYAHPASGTVQNLLQLAEEAEKQARLTSEAADTANKLAQELIDEMEGGGEGLLQLCATAGKNAYLATEAAVRAQLSAMETHAAAVNQSLAELENSKDALHHHSQGFIHLSKLAAQAQDDAELAREKAERTRLEYATKQNAALSNRDSLAQSKREYEAKLSQARFSQENLELAQQKARAAQNEYLRLKESLATRRKQWQIIQQLQPEQPQPQQLDQQQLAQQQLEQLTQLALQQEALKRQQLAEEEKNGTMAAERRQIAALVLPTPEPMPPMEAETETIPPAPQLEEDEASATESTKSSFWRVYGKIMVLALAIAVCLRLFVLDVVMVEGSSMQPTLQNSNSLISSKLAYVFQEPQRFDIILMDAPDGDGYYIKRVIALPNDHLRIEDGQVYINDAPLAEGFITDTYTEGEINTVIPDGYYFVMGDNRAASRDSRIDSIGPIAKEHITGKAIVRIFPLNSMKIL